MEVAAAAAIALRSLPVGSEHFALRAAIAMIGRQFGARSCGSIRVGEIGAWMLRWPRLDHATYRALRRAWLEALAPAGVTAPVPEFRELVPEASPLPMEALWGRAE